MFVKEIVKGWSELFLVSKHLINDAQLILSLQFQFWRVDTKKFNVEL